jgi:quercetin dioxygenase-like cupin family protein
MRQSFLSLPAALALVAASTTAVRAQAAADAMATVSSGAIAWTDAKIPGFDPGMKLALINGNPEGDGLYTLRLSFPDGYRFPAHWHPNAEHVTVLQGTLLLAMGERAQATGLQSYGAGDYLYLPGKKPHFGGAQGFTVVQLHGQGPFAINLATPAAPAGR